MLHITIYRNIIFHIAVLFATNIKYFLENNNNIFEYGYTFAVLLRSISSVWAFCGFIPRRAWYTITKHLLKKDKKHELNE